MRKTIFVFLLLLLGYQSLIWVLPPMGNFQHQWQENQVIAERYLYGPHQESVIIGTSLATRLDMSQLPNMYKMTFGGLGIFDGLTLILAKDSLPSHVYIETNFLLRKPSRELSSSVQNPVSKQIKRHFSMFRSENQPASLFIEGVKIVRRWVKQEPLLKASKPHPTSSDAASTSYKVDTPLVRGDFFAYMMQAEASKYAEPPNSTLVQSHIELLTEQIQVLYESGVKVYLFEMPIEPELQSLAVPTAIREAIEAHFSNNPMVTLLPPFPGRYYTEDGLHLGWKEAARFTGQFRKSINQPES